MPPGDTLPSPAGRRPGQGGSWILLVMLAVALLCGLNMYMLGSNMHAGEAHRAVEKGFRSVGRISTDGLASVTRDLMNLPQGMDHLYHQLTNTQDDDGHIVDLAGSYEGEAGVALQGEEPLTEGEEMEMEALGQIEDKFATEDSDSVTDGREDGGAGGREDVGFLPVHAVEAEDEGEEVVEVEAQVEAEDEGEEVAEVQDAETREEETREEEIDNVHDKELVHSTAQMGIDNGSIGVASRRIESPQLRVAAAPITRIEAAPYTQSRTVSANAVRGSQFSGMSRGIGGAGTGVTQSVHLGGSSRFAHSWMASKMNQTRFPYCGGMPKSFGPKFVQQPMPPVRTKAYPSKDGTVSPMALNNRQVKVPTEHGRRPARKATNRPRLKSGEQVLVECLNHLGKCTGASMRAALSLRGMQEAVQVKKPMMKRRHRNCAVVGNSGGMMHHQYGQHIDTHDFVIRINILPTKKHEANLGKRVDARVLSYKMAKDVCCLKKDYRADNPYLEYYIWFPASRPQVRSRMQSKLRTNPVNIMPPAFLSSAVLAFKAFRGELLRLGYGPFEDWEYMTSGMHAVFGMLRSCDNVDVYGFTTDVKATGPYWFTGRAVAPRSGQTQHAWDHERMVLRLLHAAGAINICTS